MCSSIVSKWQVLDLYVTVEYRSEMYLVYMWRQNQSGSYGVYI